MQYTYIATPLLSQRCWTSTDLVRVCHVKISHMYTLHNAHYSNINSGYRQSFASSLPQLTCLAMLCKVTFYLRAPFLPCRSHVSKLYSTQSVH